jgi:hypothetical protein
LPAVLVAVCVVGRDRLGADARVGGVGRCGPACFRVPGGCAGAGVSIPTPVGAVVIALLLASLAEVGAAHGLSQDGRPLDHQAGSLVAGVGYFRLGTTSPRCGSPMIMASSRDLPARTWRFGFWRAMPLGQSAMIMAPGFLYCRAGVAST